MGFGHSEKPHLVQVGKPGTEPADLGSKTHPAELRTLRGRLMPISRLYRAGHPERLSSVHCSRLQPLFPSKTCIKMNACVHVKQQVQKEW